MMKRLLAVLVGAAVFTVMTASVATAGQTYKYKWIGPLTLQTNIGAGAGIQMDSTTFYAPNAADVQDTFAVVVLPADFCRATDIDSLPELIVSVKKSAAGAAGDTLYSVAQPSMDGTTFTEPTWLPTWITVGGATTAGALPFRLAAAYATSTNWVNAAPRNGIRAVRVRLYWDGTAAFSNGGTVNVYLGYLSDEVDSADRNK